MYLLEFHPMNKGLFTNPYSTANLLTFGNPGYCFDNCYLLLIALEILPACHAAMDKDIFDRLPSSTNAVESHNRLSKRSKPNVLRVALISTYKIDMPLGVKACLRVTKT